MPIRFFGYFCVLIVASPGLAADGPAAERFRKTVQPLLTDYCFNCHGDGAKKGNVALDGFKSDGDLVGNRALWLACLKNLRAGIMPPPGKPRPSVGELAKIEQWIISDSFGHDPKAPDPGRVTLRRLNRIEYRNTILDLMGVDFKADDEFPADDTGYGFDTIGDVLTVSPLLLEKYFHAAKAITTAAVPAVPRVPREADIAVGEFLDDTGKRIPGKFSIYQAGEYARPFDVAIAGDYRLHVDLGVRGAFDFDPGRAAFTVLVDGKDVFKQDFGWENNKTHKLEIAVSLAAGPHQLAVKFVPLVPVEKKKQPLDLSLGAVRIQGPTDPKHWVRAKNAARFFPKDEAPADPAARLAYARDVLSVFVNKAHRRPADDATVNKLVAIAESVYTQRDRTFEDGISQAMVAVLASPRFLFRVESELPAGPGEKFPQLDEYALASRLSYFLWSTMPDEELLGLAGRNELRKNLPTQVRRMTADPRADALVKNFVGQWLQSRDVEGIVVTPRSVLDRATLRQNRLDSDQENRNVRQAMRLETEKSFEYVLREDRSVRELIDADYAFLNERLAEHYGVPGVKGPEMRKVTLPKDSPRGGILTQGTMLMVTSNPTRTSPVKRGLFVLENVLGSPPPPPPEDVPELEETIKAAKGKELTLREALELHRSKPLCSSCHSRMDPLGLALENFNALGMWRDKEVGQPIAAAGTLISGEAFKDVRELKRVISTDRRLDFYRCLTEKLMTYALGRGLDYYDVATVDAIVDRMEKADGKFSALLLGLIDSPAFQRRRILSPSQTDATR
jgi:hypothetical protein